MTERIINYYHNPRSTSESFLTYAGFQSNLPLDEIRRRKPNVRDLRKEFDNLRHSLQQQLNLIDYAHICQKFFKSKDSKLKSNTVAPQKTFFNLSKEKRFTQDPQKFKEILRFKFQYTL